MDLASAYGGSAEPSMANAYHSTYAATARQEEAARGSAMWAAAADPWATGVVPTPAFSSMFAGVADAAPSGPQTTVQTLAGETLPIEQFGFDNMVPFFRGSVKQNTDLERGGRAVEAFTGRSEHFVRKEEQSCFFEPTANMSHVRGAPNTSDFSKARIVQSIAQRNYFPIDQQRVAPGLNAGYATEGDGGVQQMSTLDFARPRNIDELRAANNPKTVYEQPIAAPPRFGEKRGELGAVEKNRPDTSFEQTPDRSPSPRTSRRKWCGPRRAAAPASTSAAPRNLASGAATTARRASACTTTSATPRRRAPT
jgi:hypothetical protein